MKILGIDEAGRGCVIGPMAVGAIVYEQKDLPRLDEWGVKDSKRLSPKKREDLCPALKKYAIFSKVRLIPPQDIDGASLNQIDLSEIVSFITQTVPDRVIFDVPTNPGGVANFVYSVRVGLRVRMKGSQRVPELIGENKADEKYPIVSAASVLAKVERDRIISELHKEYGDFGSGYMSDEKTQKFLRECFESEQDFPPIVRRKWTSVRRFFNEQQRLT